MQHYDFSTFNETTTSLQQLFGNQDYLLVLHNMGKSCPHCALWGDEFNAMARHINKVAAFCIIGPDDSATQKDYAKQRGWQSPLLSAKDNSFIEDMGFQNDQGYMPGLSIFKKDHEHIECIKQVNVVTDGRIPSVLEALMMIPDVDTRSIAWQ